MADWTPIPSDVDERLREADDALTRAEDFAGQLDEIRGNEMRRASALKAAERADALAGKCKRTADQLRAAAMPPV